METESTVLMEVAVDMVLMEVAVAFVMEAVALVMEEVVAVTTMATLP